MNASNLSGSVDTGCPSGLYNEESNVDTSPLTFATCYAISAVGITLSILLLALSSKAYPSTASAASSSAQPEKELKKPQPLHHQISSLGGQHPQTSSLGGQQHSIENVGADEPSSCLKSLRSYEELEDGSILTKSLEESGEDNEASTNPPNLPQQLQTSLGARPGELLRPPSTAENSDPDSELENSTLTTQRDQQQREAQHRQRSDDYYMTLLVCYVVFESVSFLVLGFGFMTGTDFSGEMPNRVVHGTSAFASCSLLAIAALEYLRLLSNQNQQQEPQPVNDGDGEVYASRPDEISVSSTGNKAILWTAAWMFCSLPAVIVFVVLDSDLYTGIFSGVSHFAVLLTALFRVCFCEQGLFWFLMDAAAMFFYTAGLAVQLILDGPCGYDGYIDDCNANCPLPTSPVTFNHNAIFHICVLVSLFLYGCSKMAQMQPSKQDSSTGLFRRAIKLSSSVAGSTDLSTSARKHISGAAAAVLMQDHTIEV